MTVDQRARQAAEAVRRNALAREPLRILPAARPPRRAGLVVVFVAAAFLVVVALSAVVMVNPFGGTGDIAPAPSPQTSVPAPEPTTTTSSATTSSSTSTPTPPKLTSTSGNLRLVSEALTIPADGPAAGVSVLGDLAFVGGQSVTDEPPVTYPGMRILDLSDPENPRRVGRIRLRSSGFSLPYSTGDAVPTHLEGDVFVGDVAMVLNGVPNEYTHEAYPDPYGIWNVTDPEEPELLSVLSPEAAKGPHSESGGLGYRNLDAKDVSDDGYFYFLYAAAPGTEHTGGDIRMAVADISDPAQPDIVAEWQDNPEVFMAGLVLNEAGTRAYLTGTWPPGMSAKFIYVYILDVADPANPTLIGEYEFPVRGVPSLAFKALPTEDETHVLLLDGSHDRDRDTLRGLGRKEHLGIVNILDITDLDNIRQVGSWTPDVPTSPSNWWAATDVVVRGHVAYAAFDTGFIHALDISDPTAPSLVGEFSNQHLQPWISDVALYGDNYLLATTIWGPRMYVLEILDQPAGP